MKHTEEETAREEERERGGAKDEDKSGKVSQEFFSIFISSVTLMHIMSFMISILKDLFV